jgi:hypothetical protein
MPKFDYIRMQIRNYIELASAKSVLSCTAGIIKISSKSKVFFWRKKF